MGKKVLKVLEVHSHFSIDYISVNESKNDIENKNSNIPNLDG